MAINWDKKYDVLSREFQEILVSEEYLKESLAKIPTDTISGLMEAGQFIQQWKMNKAFYESKEGQDTMDKLIEKYGNKKEDK